MVMASAAITAISSATRAKSAEDEVLMLAMTEAAGATTLVPNAVTPAENHHHAVIQAEAPAPRFIPGR